MHTAREETSGEHFSLGLTLASVLEVVDDLFKDTAMRACLNIEC